MKQIKRFVILFMSVCAAMASVADTYYWFGKPGDADTTFEGTTKVGAWTSDKTGYDGDTKTAATTYRFCREGLEFRKTWTRRSDGNGLDVAVSGITSAADYEVVTCVENANARPGAGIVSQTDEQTVVRNGNVIYEINAPPNSVHVTVENREGDWHDIMGGLPSQRHSGRIFEVYVSHGIKPNNAEFTYSVKCAPVKKGLILFLQ